MHRERDTVIDARGFAVEFVNGTELGKRTRERIDAWWVWAGHRAGDLQGGEGWNRVVGAEKVRAGFVVDGIGEIHGNRQIDIASADQILAVNVHVRDAPRKAIGEFALEIEAGLMSRVALRNSERRRQH